MDYQNIRYKATLEGEGKVRENQFANTVKLNLIDYTLKGSFWFDRNYDNKMGDTVKNEELAKVKVHVKDGVTTYPSTNGSYNFMTRTYDYSLSVPSIKPDTKVVLTDIPDSLQLIYSGKDNKQQSSFDRKTQEAQVVEDLRKEVIDNLHAGFSDVPKIMVKDLALQQGEKMDLKTKTTLEPSYLADEMGFVVEYSIKSGVDIIGLDGSQVEGKQSGEAIVIAKVSNGLFKEDGSVDGYIEKELKVKVYTKRISVSIPTEMKFQVVTNTTAGKPEFVAPQYYIKNLASAVHLELNNIVDESIDSKLKLTNTFVKDNGVYEMALGFNTEIQKTMVKTDISINDMDLQNFKAVPLGQLSGIGSDGNIANLTFTSDKFEETDLPLKPSDSYTHNMNMVFRFSLDAKR